MLHTELILHQLFITLRDLRVVVVLWVHLVIAIEAVLHAALLPDLAAVTFGSSQWLVEDVGPWLNSEWTNM